MATGRPTKYNEDVQSKAEEYVEGGFERVGDVVPSRAGLALYLGVSKATVHNWEKDHPAFLDTCKRMLALQERITLNGGLRSELNAQLSKLLLTNHGYSDRIEQDHTSSDGSMTPRSAIDASRLSDQALQELLEAQDQGSEDR